jgi:hypothetical protein
LFFGLIRLEKKDVPGEVLSVLDEDEEVYFSGSFEWETSFDKHVRSFAVTDKRVFLVSLVNDRRSEWQVALSDIRGTYLTDHTYDSSNRYIEYIKLDILYRRYKDQETKTKELYVGFDKPNFKENLSKLFNLEKGIHKALEEAEQRGVISRRPVRRFIVPTYDIYDLDTYLAKTGEFNIKMEKTMLIKCPHCKANIKGIGEYCPLCGRELER